jgi:hypothetical protein
LVETGMTLKKVGEVLGVSKRLAHLCSHLGARMAAEGVTDPYIRLTERPANVPRWVGDQREGGEGGDRKSD